MSLFKPRHPPHPDDEADTDSDHESSPIDPNLRLQTVRTAASSIAEAGRIEARAQRRKSRRARFFRRAAPEKRKTQEQEREGAETKPTEVPGLRRNVYVNTPLAADEVDHDGEPLVRYVRNKVRTSRYTILTFIPKNLYEQFLRVANIYFLAVNIVSQFAVFGAANGALAVVPLIFILTVTAIKDGIEDYRRAMLDEEVNTSAATKLCNWRNVNQPSDPRDWIEKLLGLNAPGRVTKGVKRLRARDASEIVLSKRPTMESAASTRQDSVDSMGRLEDIQSVDEHSYPPPILSSLSSGSTLKTDLIPSTSSTNLMVDAHDYQSTTGTTIAPSSVIDPTKRIPGLARWDRTLWKKLEVGDIVLLREDEQVPADIVVLSTSDPDGICYLETKNLDGETNLKPRKAVRATSAISSEGDLERAAFVLDSEPPHQNLYVYHGVLRYAGGKESVTINELLLRGCMVRNTDWIVGLVAFTGADTKIMLNGGETPSKRSKIERETNFNVVMNFIVLLIMCVVTAIASGLEDGKQNTSFKFFEHGADASDSPVLNALVTFVSCLIAFQNIVPISLYISIEIVKTIQAYTIGQDLDMYYAPFDTACVPKTWNISDDLGQIEYVFSDKTGTLTQNVMEFQKASVGGVVYGEGVTEAQRGAATREGRAGELMGPEEQREYLEGLKESMLGRMAKSFKNRYLQAEKVTLIDPKLADDLADRGNPQRTRVMAFFRALAICHSVLADRPDPANPFLVGYKAESPDEAALVSAARDAGFPFVGRTKDTLDIEALGQAERYTPLKTIEFTSTRKRMSVVVRTPDGRIVLYCKGADSIIYARLAADHDASLKAQTTRDMEAFANGGLRTLCIAYRVLGEEEYLNWSRIYDNALAAITDRDAEIDKATELVEHSLTILGATALEDKLQEGVPEAIEMLHSAGIKLWILTGDKLQTAIEIGYSCNLLKSEMDIMIISAESQEGARALIEAGLNKIASVLGPPPKKAERGFAPNAKASFAVVIDGDTLRYALDGPLKPLFLALGTQCETVVCCRVSPAQKALTVRLVKEGRDAMTLSIGDGANDVAMIQEANIGCGLFGLEGSQAAMSADYAFGQFRFLTKLLLVHGRWSYQRVAAMHCNFFYKNVIWTFAMFWFLPWNSFDATYLYQYTFILLYNVLFTSMPVIALGAFDQDLNARAALAFPQLYIRGIRGLEYTRSMFWLYMADGLYQSAVVYFVPWVVWTFGAPVQWNGRTIESLADFGTTVSVAAIVAANTYVGINTIYWTVITWMVVVGSSLIMMIWITIYSFFQSSDFIDEFIVLFGGVTFWVTIIFAVAIALLPRFLVKFWTNSYAPLDKDIVREAWVMGDLKDRLGIAHRNGKRRIGRDLEATPIMKSPHLRSASEAEHQEYQPVMTTSPGLAGGPGLPAAVSRAASPREKIYDDDDDEAQYVVVDRAVSPPTGGRSPGPGVASRLSYYSVSDIPPPSPAPPARYSMVSSRSTPGSPKSSRPDPLPRRPSASASASAQPSPLLAPGRRESYLATGPRSASSQVASFEMRVISDEPLSPYPRRDLSRASDNSYATAAEEHDLGEQFVSPSTPTNAHHAQIGGSGQPHDRNASWNGGMAM